MADKYDRMTTAELEAEAATVGADLTGADTNAERARRVRYVASRQPVEASTETEAPAQPEPVGGRQEGEEPVTAEQATAAQVGEPDTAEGPRAAPYVDGDDLQHRLDAASGADTAPQQLGEVPEVGGQQQA